MSGTSSGAAPTLRSWLQQGPFTLALSSGFFAFFAHAGALSVLEDADLLPERLTGSSAGALVAGLWAGGIDSEAIAAALFRLRREHFWDPALGLGLLRGRLFQELLDDTLPGATFDRCRRPVSVSALDLYSLRTRALTSGPLAPALRASCAVPFMFHPVWLAGRPYVDGGVFDRPGLVGLAPRTRVLLHHIHSRSRPWMRGGPPRREGMVSLSLGRLPPVGPFRLDAGVQAFHQAQQRMRQALDAPIIDAQVRVA